MKKVVLFILTFVFVPESYAQEIERMTDDLVPFVYESRAQIPTADENLASIISIEYRRARDEFTKYELMEKIKPVIKTKLEVAKTTNQYLLRIGSRLGEYDFKNKVFPSGFSEGTFIPFKNGYAVTFDNVKNIENIPVAFEKAKSLSKTLQKSREITAVIYIDVMASEEKKLNWNHHKSIKSHITKVEFITENNHIISTVIL